MVIYHKQRTSFYQGEENWYLPASTRLSAVIFKAIRSSNLVLNLERCRFLVSKKSKEDFKTKSQIVILLMMLGNYLNAQQN